MRLLTSVFCFLFSLNSFATGFKVIGKNSEILFADQAVVSVPQTVGQISINFFQQNQIPYIGDIDGIVSVYNLESELDLISDTEMKAYGWCYSINGVVPEDFVHKVNITDQSAELVWFYAYAYYKAGEWVAQCVPHGKEYAQEPL